MQKKLIPTDEQETCGRNGCSTSENKQAVLFSGKEQTAYFTSM